MSLNPNVRATTVEASDNLLATRQHGRIRPWHFAAAALAYLAMAWVLFFAVDVFNLFGSRDLLSRVLPDNPSTWYQLFRDGRVTEWLQWGALGIAGLIAAIHAGRLYERQDPAAQRLARFWVLIALALTLMLIEDAGNVRHMLRWYAYRLTDMVMAERAVEFAYFSVLAGIPLYALLRYWRDHRQHGPTHRYLLAAFAFYGIAGLSSATRHWGEWHDRVGEAALATIRRVDENFVIYRHVSYDGQVREGYWLMDMIVEESVELLGATMFLCAAMAFLHVLRGGERRPDAA